MPVPALSLLLIRPKSAGIAPRMRFTPQQRELCHCQSVPRPQFPGRSRHRLSQTLACAKGRTLERPTVPLLHLELGQGELMRLDPHLLMRSWEVSRTSRALPCAWNPTTTGGFHLHLPPLSRARMLLELVVTAVSNTPPSCPRRRRLNTGPSFGALWIGLPRRGGMATLLIQNWGITAKWSGISSNCRCDVFFATRKVPAISDG